MGNIPTRIIFDRLDAASAKLQGREEIWLRHFFGS
jgi:hypothetical protein